MNFRNVFDELNKLYESEEVAKDEAAKQAVKPNEKQPLEAEKKVVEALTEADEEDVIDIVDEEGADEAPAEEEEARQLILECDKCGALVIKDEADVTVDDETGLVDVEDACQFCEEATGYKIVGVVAPYELEESLLEGLKRVKKGEQEKYRMVTFADVKVGDYILEDPKNMLLLPKKVTGVKPYPGNDDCVLIRHAGNGAFFSHGKKQSVAIFDTVDIKARKGALKQSKKDSAAYDYIDDSELEEACKNLDEDIADWYRRKFDRPASIAAQQAWEAELNGEMGEIDDKRRAHLERKFAQQRDWEARHPDIEVK